jgi:hypothetical protein
VNETSHLKNILFDLKAFRNEWAHQIPFTLLEVLLEALNALKALLKRKTSESVIWCSF